MTELAPGQLDRLAADTEHQLRRASAALDELAARIADGHDTIRRADQWARGAPTARHDTARVTGTPDRALPPPPARHELILDGLNRELTNAARAARLVATHANGALGWLAEAAQADPDTVNESTRLDRPGCCNPHGCPDGAGPGDVVRRGRCAPCLHHLDEHKRDRPRRTCHECHEYRADTDRHRVCPTCRGRARRGR